MAKGMKYGTGKLDHIDLQLFAGDEGGDPGENVQDEGAGDVKTYTEEEVKEKLLQREKEMEEQHKKQLEEASSSAKKEAERLSKLSEDEKKAEEEARKEKELLDRERALEKKEQLSDIREELTKRKLPVSFAEFFISEDSKKSLEGIAAFEKTFREAIEEEVKSKIKGTGMKTGDSSTINMGKTIATEKNATNKSEYNPWK